MTDRYAFRGGSEDEQPSLLGLHVAKGREKSEIDEDIDGGAEARVKERERLGRKQIHSETAPEHVGTMQTAAAQLRISRCLEEDANDENRGHGGYEKRVQELCISRSDQMRQAEIGVAAFARHQPILGSAGKART